MSRARIFLLVLLLLPRTALLFADSGDSSDSGGAAPLIIGTKEAPPFAMQGPDGAWTGLAIELWDRIAEQHGLDYELREMPLDALLRGIEDGSVDAGVAALTITAERENLMDFSHPFFISGLGIAVPENDTAGWLGALRSIGSTPFLRVVGALLILLTAVGAALWIFERRRNAEQFGGGAAQGLGAAFWWSAVTMTTVGYGDKAPITLGGRLVGLVWMFASVIIISGFTAAIASSLTVHGLGNRVGGPDDLPNVRVGTLERTTSAAWLTAERIDHRAFPTLEDGLDALADGRLDALVYDAPILRYTVRDAYADQVRVLDATFERQDYGIALSKDSRYREEINRSLLREIRAEWWKTRVFETLGI